MISKNSTGYGIVAGLTLLNWDNGILEHLPTRVFIGMINYAVFTGKLEKPFKFQHNNLNIVTAFFNG